MPLDTDLNISPYFDDSDEKKNFHRIMFKPKIAIQARELNQLQAILQGQIERFGDNILKSGAIVKGCSTTSDSSLKFVRMSNVQANSAILDVSLLANTVVVSATSGLKATVVAVASGDTYPNTNRVYVKYLNSGSVANTDVQVFQPNEQLTFYTSPLSSNVVVAIANTYANTTANTFTSALATALSITDGIVYQKGFFIRVDPQILIVSDNINCGNTVVGFTTAEDFITPDQDPTLNDNALGYSNFKAPGADRLKLTTTLFSTPTSNVTTTDSFAILAQYVDGKPFTNNNATQYSELGRQMAQHEDETNGSFVIKPFSVDTVASTANNIFANVGTGTGYAKGHRIDTISQIPVTIRRGTDTASANNQLVTASYGSYVIVKELAGSFDFTAGETVQLSNTAASAITNHSFAGASPSGMIGTANIRTISYASGIEGTDSAQYNLYIYNIKMVTGNNFSSVRSVYFDGTNKGVADVVLSGGNAVLYNAERQSMIFSFGQKGLKNLRDTANNNNTFYTYRTKQSITITNAGLSTITVPSSHAGGSDKLPYGAGVIGDTNEIQDFMIVSTAAVSSANLVGTIAISSTNTTVTGTSTTLNAHFSIGEYVKVGSDVRRVVTVANATSMTVDSNWPSTLSAQNYQKNYPAGYVFPLNDAMVGTRTINVSSDSSSAAINIGSSVLGVTLASTIPAVAYFNVQRNSALPSTKTINKGLIVKIDTTSPANATGPWTLGVPDVHRIEAIYAGSSYATSGVDYSSSFTFDSGQRDTHYGLASIALRPGQPLPGNLLTVVYSAFTSSTTSGVGFYTVDSYPIDDANTANVNAITTSRIPTYESPTGTVYRLRDCVDFRLPIANTVVLTANLSNANVITANSYISNTFTIDAAGTFVPAPAKNFSSSITYYLGRKDVIYFDNRSQPGVKEGTASVNPQLPLLPEDTMAVAEITVPPFPSLAHNEQDKIVAVNKTSTTQIRDLSYGVKTSIVTNRGYTMKDIGTLDQRISNLEYYQSLSLLEKSATDLQIADVNGLDRFKNGIFADPFKSHTLGDVSNPEYKIAIDESAGILRPYVTVDKTDFDYTANSSSTAITGTLVTLPYTSVPYAAQPFATKYRNAAPVQYHWNSQLALYPNYDAYVDTTQAAAVQVTVDASSTWEQFANSPWGTSWGAWRTSAQNVTRSQTSDLQGDGSTAITTVTASSTTSTRDVQKLAVGTNATTYNVGNYVSDISINPYLRSRQVAFVGWNFRPNTTLHAFFDGINVDAFVAPGTRIGATTNDPTDDAYVSATAAFGTPLRTDASGNVYGKFIIPPGAFRMGERTLELADTTSLSLGNNSITTMGSTSYVGSSLSVTKTPVTLTTITASLSIQTSSEASTTTDITSSVNVIRPPVVRNPPPPPPKVDTGGTTPDLHTPTVVCDVNLMQQFRNASSDSQYNNLYISLINTGYPLSDPCGYFQIPPDYLTHVASGGPDDPIAQTINCISPTVGVFLTSINLYFKQKSFNVNNGVTVYLCEVNNGYPDTSKIVSYSRTYLPYGSINTSDNGAVATTFTFPGLVYLQAKKSYTFVVIPDGGDPDYLIWMAQLGDLDVATGVQVFQQPYAGTAFYGATQGTWTALQNEYIKFTLNRADFTALYATANFRNHPYDFLSVSSPSYANSSVGILPGDTVFAATNTTPTTVNTSIMGTVLNYDSVKSRLDVDKSTGLFNTALASANTLQVHHLVPGANTPNANTLVATYTLNGISDLQLNAISPYFASMTPTGTALSWSMTATNASRSKDGTATRIMNEYETELFDYERRLVSLSNQVTYMSSNSSLLTSSLFSTNSTYLSPVVDMIRAGATVIGNLIDPVAFVNTTDVSVGSEYYNNGLVKSKYVSVPVTLAQGQDAEDINVYLTAYKPLSSDIKVYARFLNGSDPDVIRNKTWTLLVQDDTTIYSDYNNIADYREFLYKMPIGVEQFPLAVPPTPTIRIPSATSPATSALAYSFISVPLQYTDTNGVKYTTYKQFQIKIVLLSDTTARVPRLNDVRAVCLQL